MSEVRNEGNADKPLRITPPELIAFNLLRDHVTNTIQALDEAKAARSALEKLLVEKYAPGKNVKLDFETGLLTVEEDATTEGYKQENHLQEHKHTGT